MCFLIWRFKYDQKYLQGFQLEVASRYKTEVYSQIAPSFISAHNLATTYKHLVEIAIRNSFVAK